MLDNDIINTPKSKEFKSKKNIVYNLDKENVARKDVKEINDNKINEDTELFIKKLKNKKVLSEITSKVNNSNLENFLSVHKDMKKDKPLNYHHISKNDMFSIKHSIKEEFHLKKENKRSKSPIFKDHIREDRSNDHRIITKYSRK